MVYWVKPYDGEGGVSLATVEAVPAGPFDTIDAARTWIKRRLGGDFGQWDGVEEDGDIECWHESDTEGCGGFAISESP